MQLDGKKSIRGAVTAITAALLGATGAGASGQDHHQASLLIYSETNRVTAIEALYGFNRQLDNGYTLGLHLTFDGLTGATPNGAAPSRKVQTFTGSSQRGTTTIQPGQLPLDPSFKDARIAGDGSLGIPLGRLTNLTFGAHLSLEHDYSSMGINSGITQDLFEKNTTIGVSGSYSHDVSSPVGGAPVPYSLLSSVKPRN